MNKDLIEVLKAQNKKIKQLESVLESMQTALKAIDEDLEYISKIVLER